MNRTKKLMTAVTTSLMLSGTLPVPGAVVLAFGQTAPQPDESWKTDPQVQYAADNIFQWIRDDTPQCHDPLDKTYMQTQEDVVKKFPQYDPALVQKALRKLVYVSQIKQSGAGSKDNPFCYCAPPTSGSGGG